MARTAPATKQVRKNAQQTQKQASRGTPAAPNINRTVGNAVKRALSAIPRGTFASLGGNFAGPMGALAGKTLSTITGYGDYALESGQDTSKFGGEVPHFQNGNDNTVIRHREYVGIVESPGTAFTNISYDINPGNSALFPWLSCVARSYQQYKIKSMAFIFKSLTSEYSNSGGLGQVIMATNYNVNDDAYSSSIQMENSEYAVAMKPSVSMLHPLECASHLRRNDPFYVYDPRANSTGAVTDKRFRDMGKFQIATEGLSTTPGVTIGQLWITYEVELLKPVVPYGITSFSPSYWSSPNYTDTGSYTANIVDPSVVVDGLGAAGGIVITISNLAGRSATILWHGLAEGLISHDTTLSGMTVTPSSSTMEHDQRSANQQGTPDTFTGHAVVSITSNTATFTVNAGANTAYNSGWVWVYTS